MGAPRRDRPRWLGTLLAACLATLPAISACPRPCACRGSAELHCTFRYFTAVPPRIPPGVQRINLGYNSLRKLSPTDFAGLEKLELLMLHSNEISTIPEKVFSDLRSLQVLKMSYNKVRELQQDVFYGLNSLVRLHMDHNQIEFVNPSVFYGLTSLRLVHLDGNLLQQLHPDTFVTLRYSQIFRVSFLKHISLSDNMLTSLPREMFSYMSELESIYLHGNPWSCDCSLQGFAEWAQDRPDVIKCRKERSSSVQQCPVCASPKNHNGKSLVDLPSASFTCSKPVIHDSLKSRDLMVPEDGDFSFVSPKDLIAPIGSVVLNMTDQAGNRGDLVCDVQKPEEMSPVSFDKNGSSTVLKASFSAFLVCGIDPGHIQQLWSILALYSNSPLNLERTVRTADVPFTGYQYKQVHSEKDELFTDVEAAVRAEPGWLMQSRVSLQLDRTATTLSTLHVRYSTHARIGVPGGGRNQERPNWAIIARDNGTRTEHTVLVGGSVELGCRAAGRPAPAVQWILADGSRVPAPHVSEDGRILVLESGALTLRAADVFDTGLYRCIGTNRHDADALAFRITVVDPGVERGAVNGARLSAALGSTLHLPCTSTAAPDAAVTWVSPEHAILPPSAGNKRVFANGTLRIHGVTERDVGYFRCVAANRYGADLLVFQVLPRIAGGKLAAFTVLANSDALIPCEATGNPPPTIEWTKIPSGSDAAGPGSGGRRWAALPNGTLSIPRAGLQDRGQYLCTAANPHGAARLLVTLAVLARPPRVSGGRSLTAHSGSSASLPCRAQGSPAPRISWLLANGTRLSHGSAGGGRAGVEPDGTLVIRAVSVYDRGLYTCLAENPAGTDTLAVKLQVVAAPPTVLEEKRQSVAGTAGESLELPCTAQGQPRPSVHWVLPDGRAVKPLQPVRPGLLLLPDGTLRLGSAAPSDSGTYECIATSSTGSDRRVVSLVVQRRDALPKIAVASQELTRLNFGERLLLNCTASGEPKPRIIWRLPSKAVVDQWHRMGSRIHVYPNGSLAIEAVTEKDAGDYLCVARNRIGDDLVLMKVSITMKPAKIDHKQQFKKLVPYGKDFRVDCKASGSPTPEISWGLPDGTVVNNAMLADDSGRRARRYVLFDNGTLYLNRAGVAEGGDYTCYAQNTLGRDEMKVHVTVIVAAPQIKHNYQTHVTVTAGDAALLDCEAAGEPRAQIFWLLPSSEMISSSTERHSLHANGSLSIGHASLLDAGEYMCVARNPGGDDTKLYKLDVAAKPPVINGLYRNKTVMKVTAVRHSKKHIDCRAEGSPPPQIMWIMPDNIFLTAPYYGSRIVVHKNGTLEIRNIRPSDAADFICVARNDGGESVLVVQLEVTEMLRRPMFKNPFNEKIIAKPGKTVTLNCSVDGNPPPEISWMLPNGTWFPSSVRTSQFLTGSDGTLTIPNPEGRHAGRYRCAARNQVGYIEKLVVLEVAQKPSILTRPAGLVKGVSGEPLSLHCLAQGSPKPRVAWTLPGGRVLERPQVSGRHLLLENGTLLIRAASAQDAGNYVCRAHNDAGDSSLSTAVVVAAYAPRIVGRPPPAIHTVPGAPVQLHCVVLGIPKPEISWELPDRSVLSTAHQGRGSGGELLHATGTLLLQNPRASSSGAYKCTARNPLGTDTAVTYVHVI
ncbi:hypothetical protein DUI87_21024 [Hirundo rustica rustica]|uniref:Immunoglobulin superfamily member 10 n=1 Tax=Hirundo rustica rustica TaxID=333673 RepID=A0A3M0JLP2_HIRRU|nr:hypothetical protein DUI87_21024 [Hirundo rustica rustica]